MQFQVMNLFNRKKHLEFNLSMKRNFNQKNIKYSFIKIKIF